MKKSKSKNVARVIDNWNYVRCCDIQLYVFELIFLLSQHFFNPRRIEVALMQGVTRLSGLDKKPTSSSTPGWSGSSLIQPKVGSELDEGKGKAKEEEDTRYRLFIMSL
jgi:hypothetical protein